MTQVSTMGTVWNLPNYAGELFSADSMQTPLLAMIGGLSGGRMTSNFEFPTAVLFDYPEAAQPRRRLLWRRARRRVTWCKFIRRLLI